ncbi:MAG: nucleotidyl transferase AbiEii/AbiGii toxin family protein [Myxococcales bacterium]|nr:nucleotidyl transferase AbiEii/AbiGii toxin family protein [Myxococcales bacterium]
MTAFFRPPSRLTPLQQDLVRAFFALDSELFLTGGAALAGYWLGHRTTDDLDLFGLPTADADQAVRTLGAAARSVGAESSLVQASPDFRRLLVRRGAETCKVDIVVDRAPAVEADKEVVDGVRLDSRREIAANKVCALVSRAEIRDLVDLQALLSSGCSLDDALADAAIKDGGAEPATLAWILSQLSIGPDAKLPGDVRPEALLAFRDDLVGRLRKLAAAVAR